MIIVIRCAYTNYHFHIHIPPQKLGKTVLYSYSIPKIEYNHFHITILFGENLFHNC